PIQPKPDFNSTNNVSVAWKSQPLERLRDLALELGSGKSDRYYAISADVVRDSKATPMEDRGFRLERVVTNLTDKKRLGTEDAPFQMGDELLLTYQFEAKKRHHYVALTDELPAGIEVVNFDLPQIAAVYRLPDSVKPTLHLSHSELRDQSANLYFNTVSASHHTYAILARVTGSGDFIWPSTQIQPMYQPYFGGLTAGRVAHSQRGP
ncbi:MAG: alpha-2-macroglobulin family protein, partial [Verrucomicrobiales bacterium]